MQQAADQWLQTSHAKVLAEVPYTGPQGDALRKRLRERITSRQPVPLRGLAGAIPH